MNELVHHLADRLPAIAKPNDATTFKSIFVVSFVLFLTIALCAQVMALPWRTWLPGAEGHKSLVGGVRSSVYTFMSYLN